MTNGTDNASRPTPDSNAQQIAQLTQAVDVLVSQFIRPNAQQAVENQNSISQIIELIDRHANAIVQIDERLERLEGIVEANAQQIASNAENGTRFDERLEETRQLVAKNSSDFAQMNTETKASLDQLIEENRAFRESQQTQLAAIIGNARRIDRLEQQAS